MFEPRVKVFEVDRFDKWLRGTPFAYIDIVDEMGVMHLSAFDSHDIRLKLKTILTNRDFTYKNSQVAVIFARSKSDIKDIRKVVKEVYEQIRESFPPELIELYERAHEEGFFVDLEGACL